MKRRLLLAAPAGFGFAAPRRGALAQERSLRVIVPFPPGGAADFLARAVAEPMGQALGQNVQIENRTGAGGNIGTAVAAQVEADGNTILLNGLPIAVNRFLYPTLPYDAERDFVPLGLIAISPNIMVVPNDLPVNDVAGFVALARSRPLNYASIGNGTSLHLAGAQFALAAGVDMTHVPYRETGAANTDVMTGRVEVMFQTIAAAAGLVRGGRLKALAVTSAERAPGFETVPTLREAGVDLVSVGWFGLFAPRATPADRVARLEAVLRASVSLVAARITGSGSIPRPLPGPEFAAFIAEETRRLGELVRATGIRAD